MIENPPSFVVRAELQKAAFDNGFRIELGLDSGWLRYRSTTAQGDIWLAAGSKDRPWFLVVGVAAVATELGLYAGSGGDRPGVNRRQLHSGRRDAGTGANAR